MPRTNYVLAWNNLKEVTRWIINAGAPSISPTTVLSVMLILEHNPVDFDHLNQLAGTLTAPGEKGSMQNTAIARQATNLQDHKRLPWLPPQEQARATPHNQP